MIESLKIVQNCMHFQKINEIRQEGYPKISRKNDRIQNSMLHFELGIQIKQGWQFLNYCHNAIEKLLFYL